MKLVSNKIMSFQTKKKLDLLVSDNNSGKKKRRESNVEENG